MEKARYNTELYSNLRAPLNNVKPSNFWGSHHSLVSLIFLFVFFSYKVNLSLAYFCFFLLKFIHLQVFFSWGNFF